MLEFLVVHKMLHIMHNIKEYKGVQMFVIVLNGRTPSFDCNTCMG